MIATLRAWIGFGLNPDGKYRLESASAGRRHPVEYSRRPRAAPAPEHDFPRIHAGDDTPRNEGSRMVSIGRHMPRLATRPADQNAWTNHVQAWNLRNIGHVREVRLPILQFRSGDSGQVPWHVYGPLRFDAIGAGAVLLGACFAAGVGTVQWPGSPVSVRINIGPVSSNRPVGDNEVV